MSASRDHIYGIEAGDRHGTQNRNHLREPPSCAWDDISTGHEDAQAIGELLDPRDIVTIKTTLIGAAETFEEGRYSDFVAAVRGAEARADLADLLADQVRDDAEAVQGWCGPEWRNAIAEALSGEN
jgi:hypothetical protein